MTRPSNSSGNLYLYGFHSAASPIDVLSFVIVDEDMANGVSVSSMEAEQFSECILKLISNANSLLICLAESASARCLFAVCSTL